MKVMRYCFFLLVIINSFQYAQSISFKGKVLDYETNASLAGVNIYDSSKVYTASTDNAGNFLIKNIPPGKYDFTFSFIGYLKQNISVVINNSVTSKIIKLIPAPVTLGEVTVTSTKTDMTIKDTPLPMEIETKKTIEETNSVTAPDLLSNLPGVALQRDGIWATSVNIRGLGSSSQVILIDGDRIETATDLDATLSLIDLNDIERIEVIKGAASSLYGTGALGGVVNFITKAPDFSDELSTSGAISSYYNSVNKGYSHNVNFDLKRNFWYFSINGTLRKAGNTKTPSGILNNSQYSDNNISALLELLPFENQSLKIEYQKYKGNDIGIPGGYPLFPDNALVKYSSIERNLFSAKYEVKNISTLLNKISLKYYNQNIYRNVENIPYLVQHPKPLQDVYVESITPNARHYTNGIQFQTNFIPSSNQILVAGIDIWQRKIDSRREKHLKMEMLDSSGSVINTNYQTIGERPLPEASFTSIGMFAEDDINLTKKLKLSIGGRIDRINVSNSEISNPVYVISNGVRNDSPPNRVLYWASYNAHDISWSGNVGCIYSINEQTDITFNFARSFRSPSLEERYQYIDLGNLVKLGDPGLKPEKGYFVDMGLRIWDNFFLIKWNVYLNLLNDLVTQVPGTYEKRPALIETNIGKARLYGSDISLQYNYNSWSSVYFNASYTIGRDILNDLYLPQIPPLNGIIGLRLTRFDYQLDISANIFAAQNKVAPGEITTPGYAYFNSFIQSPSFKINFADCRIIGGIQNFTNKSYRNHLSTSRGFIREEPGRNFYLKLIIGW
jgi:hemoglobin/transferrin/lactoferrin receptor protein